MAATISELKDMIVDLKVSLVKVHIPEGCCPYTQFSSKKDINCSEIDCDACRSKFFKEMREAIRQDVEKL